MKVNYDEVLRMLDFKDQINDAELHEIEWVRDNGETIQVDPKILSHWKFVGMTNIAFVEMMLMDVVAGRQSELVKEITEFENLK